MAKPNIHNELGKAILYAIGQGHTVMDVAEAFEVSKTWVNMHIKEAGIPHRKPGPKPKEKQ